MEYSALIFVCGWRIWYYGILHCGYIVSRYWTAVWLFVYRKRNEIQLDFYKSIILWLALFWENRDRFHSAPFTIDSRFSFCPFFALHLQHKRTRKRDYDAGAADVRLIPLRAGTKRREGEKKMQEDGDCKKGTDNF